MTTEQAIKNLNDIKSMYRWSTGAEDAIDMAIFALEAQDVPDTNVGDILSRQSLIDSFKYDDDGTPWTIDDVIYRLEQFPSVKEESSDVGSMIYRQAAIGTVKKHYRVDNDILEVIVYELENLPSAQPEQHWIPVSERLPDEYGEYLVAKHTFGWNCEECVSNDIAYFDNDGFHKADMVIAWMPLPEPYRTERRTNNANVDT